MACPPLGSKDVAVGTTIAIIVEEKAAASAFASYSEGGGGAVAAHPMAQAPLTPHTSSIPPLGPVNSRLGPAARMLLSEAGLSRDQVLCIPWYTK